MLNRIRRGIFSNSYGQIVNIAIQFIGATLFLGRWSTQEYGRWLLLYTVPAYISMLDFGLMSTLSNRVVILRASGNLSLARKIINTSLFYCLAVALSVSIIGIILIIVLIKFNLLISDDELVPCVALVLLSALLFSNSFFDMIYRYSDRYAYGTFVLSTARIFEWGGGVVGLVVWGDFSGVAVGMLVARLACVIYITYDSIKDGEVRLSVDSIDVSVLKNDIKPALAFMLFPISNAISIQGVLPIINSVAGPSSVVVFSCTRTLVRVVTQMLTIVNRAYWPEFSKKYGEKDFTGLKKLEKSAFKKNILVAIIGGGVLIVFGEVIFKIWLRGEVDFRVGLMFLMAGSTLVTAFWQAKWVLLMATNKHSFFAVMNLFAAAIFGVCVYIFMKIEGLNGVAVAMIAYEFLLLFFVRRAYGGIFHEK